MTEPRRPTISPEPRLPRGPRLLIAALHVALAGAIVKFIVDFLGFMIQRDISFGKVFYVPIGAALLAAFIFYRGVRWLRGGG
jgi:hypothetical protein